MSEWTNFNNVDDIFRSSTEGLPDNHVITVRERYLDVDIPELIQNNIKTDTITLDLDAEWEGITPVIILGSADDAVEVYYNGEPVTIPSQVAKEVGWVDCSVTGYDATGTVRLVTVAAPDTFQVIESGLYTGEVPEEEGTTLLGQLLDAAKDAQAAADSAEDKIETIDTKLTEVDTKLTEVDTKLTEVDTKLTEVDTEVDTKLTQVDTKLTEVDTKVNELTTVAGNAQKAAQNAQTAAETAQKAAEDAESSVIDAIFMDATDEKPGEKFLTDADGNVLQDVYLTTANGVGDKEQYVNIGRSGERNAVAVHGGRAHAQLWTRASADGQHYAYLSMYDTPDDGTQRPVLQIGVTDGTSVLELNGHTVNDISLDSFADAENPSNKNLVTEKAVKAAIDAIPEALPEGGTEGQVLTKTSDGKAWQDIPEALPEGGTTGQVLTKTADGEAWQDAPEQDMTGMATFKSVMGTDILAKMGTNGQAEFVPQLAVVPNDYDPSSGVFPTSYAGIGLNMKQGGSPELRMFGNNPKLNFGGKEISEITDDIADGSSSSLATTKAVKNYADSVGVPEGGTPGQLLSKTDSGTAWLDAPEADMTNVAKIVGNQLVSYDGSSIDYVNVRGESSDSYGRVSGMGGIGFVSAGTGNDFIRLKSDSSGQCIGIRKDGVDTEYTISDTISETENTLATGKAVKDAVAAIPKPDLSRVVKLNDETNNANFADGSGRVEGITIRPVNNGHAVSSTVNVADGQSTGGYVSVGSNTDSLGMYVTDHPFIRHVVDSSVTDYTISDEISEGTNTLATGKAVADYVEAQTKKNVLVSTATGKVAHAEDAFAEKPREVRIKGKTWKNLWPVINGSSNGVTVSTDETGLITVSGARNDGGDGTGSTVSVGAEIALVAGDTYAFSLSNANGTVDSSNKAGIMLYIIGDGSPYWELNLGGKTSGRITVPAQATNIKAHVGATSTASETLNASFRVMLVEGDTAPDCFIPPTSIASVEPTNMLTCGKNLLRLLPDLAPLTTNGVTFTPQDDGGILVNGTATSTAYYNLDFKYDTTTTTTTACLNGQTVTCSGYISSVALKVGCFTDIANDQHAIVCTPGAPTGTIPKDGQAFRSFLEVTSGTTINDVTVYPQLELGSTATAYEPPNVTQTPLPEVELRSLPNGTCDELVIGADGTCRVERKTRQVTFDGSQTFIAEARGGRYRFRYDPGDVDSIPQSTGLYSNNLIASVDPLIDNMVEYAICQYNVNGLIYFSLGDETTAEEANAWFTDNPTTVIYYVTDTENESPVTLPVLPAPTFNVYHDSDVPSDTSVTYENDVNIAISNMQKTIDALLGGN